MRACLTTLFLVHIAMAAPFPWKYHDLPALPESRLHRLTAEASFTVLATYNVQPENAAGSKIAYTMMLEPVIKYNVGVPAEVRVIDKRTGADERVVDGVVTGLHSGANVSWASGDLLITKAKKGYIVIDVNTKETVASMDWWANDYAPENDMIIGWGGGWPSTTIYGYDLAARRERVLITQNDLARFAEAMRTTSSPKTWSLSDTRWAPGGKRFSFHCSAGELGKSMRFLFIADMDGKNISFFAEKEFAEKPMHDAWYDENGIFAHDDRHFNEILRNKLGWGALVADDFTMRVWSLDGGKRIERIAPPGCHGSISGDKRWAASESWYTTDPIEFNVYPIGNEGGYTIFRSDLTNIVWELRAHINPVFSRDSKRLYFNRPVSPTNCEVWWADLEGL